MSFFCDIGWHCFKPVRVFSTQWWFGNGMAGGKTSGFTGLLCFCGKKKLEETGDRFSIDEKQVALDWVNNKSGNVIKLIASRETA